MRTPRFSIEALETALERSWARFEAKRKGQQARPERERAKENDTDGGIGLLAPLQLPANLLDEFLNVSQPPAAHHSKHCQVSSPA